MAAGPGRRDSRGREVSGAAQKHERETVRAVQALHPGIRCTVQTRSNTHKLLLASIGGVTVRHGISCSPKDRDTMVERIVREVRNDLRSKGVQL